MDSRRNIVFRKVRVHLLDLFVVNPDGLGRFREGKGLVQLDLNPLQSQRIIEFSFLQAKPVALRDWKG